MTSDVTQPTPDMLAVAEKLAAFIAGRGEHLPGDLFADDISIVENFAPFVFRDVPSWAKAMRAHLADLSDLRHSFGGAIDFARDGDEVYFSLPTTWSGLNRGVPFTETGGWALVLTPKPLTQSKGGWRLKAYGWAVIQTSSPAPSRHPEVRAQRASKGAP